MKSALGFLLILISLIPLESPAASLCSKAYSPSLSVLQIGTKTAKWMGRISLDIASPLPLPQTRPQNEIGRPSGVWSQARKAFNKSFRFGVQAHFLIFALLTLQSSSNLVDLDQYEVKMKSDSVDLLVETVPFPHLALRIGNQVYSYGVTHISALNLTDYLLEHKQKTSDFNVVRVIQYVRLKISHSEILRLKTYLDLQIGKSYQRLTYINDCASMIARALRKNTAIEIPEMIDPSPGEILAYFSLLKTSGNTAIAEIGQIFPDEDTSRSVALVRNFWINTLDGKFWLYGLPFNSAARKIIDYKFNENEVQQFDDTTLAEIDQQRQSYVESYSNSLRTRALQIQIQSRDGSADRIALFHHVRNLFENEFQRNLQIQRDIQSLGKDAVHSRLKNEAILKVRFQMLSLLISTEL